MSALSRSLFAVLALHAAAGWAQDIRVESTPREHGMEVTCRVLLDAPADLVWQTLTDYNRLAEFVPGMRSSRVLEQRAGTVVVEQLGEAKFLFFSVPVEVTLTTTERPPYAIDARMLKGNLKRFEGAYRIEPQPGGRVLLRWAGLIEPGSAAPPLLGELIMRSVIEDQFRGMVREIERREQLRRGQDKPPGS
jgi:ribosome-associated toxin RatA of RatAB toxin-antitoxin module